MSNKKNPRNFYLNISKIGDRIFHRYYDSMLNKRVFDVVEDFPVELYIENTKKPDYKGLHGEKLATVQFQNPKDAR